MSQLPRGWVETNFEDVSDYIQRGKGPKYAEFSEYPVVNQKAVRWFGIQEEHLKYVHPEQWDKWDELRHIREGDILWNSTGTGTIGRACHIDQTQLSKAKVVDSHITIVRANKLVESKFAFYWIMHPEIQGNINGLYNGSTNQVELSKKIIESTRFPLAPLAEQTCIVKKLDEVLAQVEATQVRLARIPDIIKRFRQSVLAAAASGKLSEEWRGDSSYSEMDLNLEKTDKFFYIPTTWRKIRLSDACQVISGYAFKSQEFLNEGKVPAIKISNIQYGQFEVKNQQFLPVEHLEIYKKFVVIDGDLLMALTRPITNDTLKVCRYPSEQPTGLLNQRVAKFIFKNENEKAFFELLFQSDYFKVQVLDKLSETLQPNLSPVDLKKFIIATPNELEQTEIVRRVEQLFAYADSIEQQAKAAKERVDKLTQAILAKAFRGELTADWRAANPDLISGDNSAAALLARIQAERAANGGKNKSAR